MTAAVLPTPHVAPFALPTHARAVVLEEPGRLAVRELALATPGISDVLVEVEWTGISTGTERLLWSGTMPFFPGLGYPLVPGYEAVGRVRWTGEASGRTVGERVFVPGSYSFTEARNLFGGAAALLVAPGARVIPVGEALEAESVLLALGATAMHAVRDGDAPLPDLIVGHGALGRLAARLVCALGGTTPTVWEIDPARAEGATGYAVVRPEDDSRRDYRRVLEVSGADGVLDTLIGRLRPGGEIVVAGFYTTPLAFQFVPAFLRGLRLRVAAEWRPEELRAVCALATDGRLALGGLITHRANASDAAAAYATAFGDPACIKMVIDWRNPA